MRFIIVQAELQHLDQAATLFDAYRQFYEQPSDLQGARAFLEARIKQQQSVIFIALDDQSGRGLGFVQLYPSFSSVRMRPIWILNDLFVQPDARNHGIGYRLMHQARQLAEDTGAAVLSLATARDNTTAKSLYEGLDYERDDEFDHYNLTI